MKLKYLPDAMGYMWFKNAVQAFRLHARMYIAVMISIYAVKFLLLALLPAMGDILGLFVSMLGHAAIMITYYELTEKQLNPVGPFWLDIFQRLFKCKSLLTLALLYMICYVLLSFMLEGLFATILPAQYEAYLKYIDIFKSSEETPPDILIQAHLYIHAVNIFLATPRLLLLGFFCMTPALVYWGKISPLKAIAYNFYACKINWRTWFFYIIGWTVVIAALLIVVFITFALLTFLFDKAGIALVFILIYAFLIIFTGLASIVMNISLYLAYQNSFINPLADQD